MKQEKSVILGIEFESKRKKIKKDKRHFASLDSKEVSEDIVENGRSVLLKPAKEDDSVPALPFGSLK